MSRFAVILLSVTVCIVIGVANAGKGNIAFLAVLLTDGLVAALWVGSAAMGGWASLRAMRVKTQEYSVAIIVSTSAAIGLGVFSLVVLGLGLAGWLNQWTVVSLPLLSIIAGGAALLRKPPGQLKERIEAWFSGRAGVEWLWLAVIPTLGLALVSASQPPGLLWRESGDPHPYDVLEYHLQVPREWYEAGRIEKTPHNAFGFFPFNSEMQFLASMYLRGGPWAGMYTAQYINVAIGVLMVVAVYGVGKQLTGNAVASIAGAAAAGAVPWTGMLSAVAFNEAGLMLYGVIAVGWIAIAIKSKSSAIQPFVVAGLAAGFACGTKYTGVPMLLIGLPAATLVACFSGRLVRNSAVYLLAALIVFSPWLIRNVVWTGNPVFPEAMNVLGKGHFTDAQMERWHRAHTAAESQRAITKRLAAFWRETLWDSRFGFLILPAGIGFGILAARRPEARLIATLLVILAGFWICLTHLQSRFFTPAIPLAGLLIAVGAAELKNQFRLIPVGAALCISLLGLGILQTEYTRNMLPTRKLSLIGLRELHYLLIEPGIIKMVETPGIKLALVGDGRAFLYTLPMKNLRYRTVFDITEDGAPSHIDAFIGPDAAAVRREYHLQIVPEEIDRLNSSYKLNFKDWPPKPASRPAIDVGPAPR